MKKTILILLLFTCLCTKTQTTIAPWVPYDESKELAETADNESVRLRFKLIQSRVLDKNAIWKNVAAQISDFQKKIIKS
jgi:amidase